MMTSYTTAARTHKFQILNGSFFGRTTMSSHILFFSFWYTMRLWLLYTLWGALPILVQAYENVIPDQYIVILDDHFDKIVTRIRLFLSNEKRPKLLREYRRGIVVSGLTGEVAERWARDPAVLSIVPVSYCCCLVKFWTRWEIYSHSSRT
jgi:hypothetical protein